MELCSRSSKAAFLGQVPLLPFLIAFNYHLQQFPNSAVPHDLIRFLVPLSFVLAHNIAASHRARTLQDGKRWLNRYCTLISRLPNGSRQHSFLSYFFIDLFLPECSALSHLVNFVQVFRFLTHKPTPFSVKYIVLEAVICFSCCIPGTGAVSSLCFTDQIVFHFLY